MTSHILSLLQDSRIWILHFYAVASCSWKETTMQADHTSFWLQIWFKDLQGKLESRHTDVYMFLPSNIRFFLGFGAETHVFYPQTMDFYHHNIRFYTCLPSKYRFTIKSSKCGFLRIKLWMFIIKLCFLTSVCSFKLQKKAQSKWSVLSCLNGGFLKWGYP